MGHSVGSLCTVREDPGDQEVAPDIHLGRTHSYHRDTRGLRNDKSDFLIKRRINL